MFRDHASSSDPLFPSERAWPPACGRTSPKGSIASWRRRSLPRPRQGTGLGQAIASELDRGHPGPAASLREGLEGHVHRSPPAGAWRLAGTLMNKSMSSVAPHRDGPRQALEGRVHEEAVGSHRMMEAKGASVASSEARRCLSWWPLFAPTRGVSRARTTMRKQREARGITAGLQQRPGHPRS